MTTVAIVGAGIHGVSAAYHLASRGLAPMVFDKGPAAGGPTGRSSAICRAYYTNAFLAAVAAESLDMFRSFADITKGRDAGYRENGIVYLHPHEHVDQVSTVVERLNAQGIETLPLTPDAVRSEFPALTTDGVGIAVWQPGAGYADPAGTTIGLLERAVELGAESVLGRSVVQIKERSGGGAALTLDDGAFFECDRLLVAAGPWTAPLCRMVGVDLPLTVERHIVATFGLGADERLPYSFSDLVNGYYYKPEGEELFCLGPSDASPDVDPDDFAEEVSDGEVLELAERVVRRAPCLEDAHSRGGWASLYDVSPDWQPVIGEVADGIFVDAGTSGHGFKLAPALGRHVADLVTGDSVVDGLVQFHPRRFEDNALLAGGYGANRILG